MSARVSTYLASAAFWLLAIGLALAMRAGTANANAGGPLPGSTSSTAVLPGSTLGQPGSPVSQPDQSTESSIVAGVPLTTPVPCILPFYDVQESDYYYQAVKDLYCHGAISGYGDGTFRPDTNLTRAQICKIVVLALDIPLYTPQKPSFEDVPTDNTFYTYIESYWHAAGGNCSDCSTTFRPYSDTTRGQLAKIIVLAACWPIYTPPVPTFSDVPISNPFYQYIETAYDKGIISGYADATFRPFNNITRGQVSKVVYRAILEGPACAAPTPGSVPSGSP